MNLFLRILLLGVISLAPLAVYSQTSARADFLRQDLARIQDDVLTIDPEPEPLRILAPAPVLFHLEEDVEYAPPGGIEIVVETEGPAHFELQPIYDGRLPYVVSRRSVEKAGSAVLRWDLPVIDKITSFTLAVRADPAMESARIRIARIAQFALLAPAERMRAFTPYILTTPSAVIPPDSKSLPIRVNLPEDVKSLFGRMECQFHLTDGDGNVARQEVQFPRPMNGEEHLNRADFELSLPDWVRDVFTLRLMVSEEQEWHEVASTTIELARLQTPHFEVPYRSIEDFSVVERNGELAIYAVVGDENARRKAGDPPLARELVWLAVGNGREWAVSEPVLRGRHDIEWIAGGPVSFTAGRIDEQFHGHFTSAGGSGLEGFCSSYAVSSLRLSPSAKNPVWYPGERDPVAAPLWRGNAFFELNGSILVVSLLKKPGEAARPHAIVSPLQTRWTDLGPLPITGLDENALHLTGFQEDDEYFLLAAPSIQLFKASESPLRDWKKIRFDPGVTWENPQFLRWGGSLWYFGMTRHNGRGVVTWARVERDGDSFVVMPDVPFVPPAIEGYPSNQPKLEN